MESSENPEPPCGALTTGQPYLLQQPSKDSSALAKVPQLGACSGATL